MSMQLVPENASNDDVGAQIWNQVRSVLRETVQEQVYSAYIEPLVLTNANIQTGSFVFAAPSRLVARHADERYRERIEEILRDSFSIDSAQVQIAYNPALFPEKLSSAAPLVVFRRSAEQQNGSSLGVCEKGAPPAPFAHSSPINSKYTFTNFVVGSSNQFCHAAAMRVAEQPGKSYNPLFIYGGVGLGKTHLLHAIYNTVIARSPNARILYMSSESFTNELIQALRLAKMDEFKQRLRAIEVLLIDDIQFMRGKERTQEEFFHTFNALYNLKRQIVITSDQLPQEIPGIEERLKTRFAWGLTADLQAPDFETRVAILKRKALAEGIVVPEPAIHLIAEKISSNVRELEGALTRLYAASSLSGTPITLEFADSALRPLLQPKSTMMTIEDIQRVVAEHFSLRISDLVSKRRTKNLSFPRHIAMYLCRKHTTASYPEIGARFGGRDHSSVIHAAHVVTTKLEDDHDTQHAVQAIEQSLRR